MKIIRLIILASSMLLSLVSFSQTIKKSLAYSISNKMKNTNLIITILAIFSSGISLVQAQQFAVIKGFSLLRSISLSKNT